MVRGKHATPQEIYWERKRREERERVPLLPAGFVNHGNTCFMNSVLQGLVATRQLEHLVRFKFSDSFRLLVSPRSPLLTNGRGPENSQRDWVQGMALGDAFIQILERSWKMREAMERSSMSPRELLSRLGVRYDQYLDFRQQDAHEFLLHLLDGVRMEEFDIIKQRQPPRPRKRKSRSHAQNGTKYTYSEPIPEGQRLTSFVDMIFGGKLASVLICETCKHVSHTLEDFDDLSLSIAHDESKERMRDRLRTFAAKFKSSSQRVQGQKILRPMSFSQPPSPLLRPTTLDVPTDAQEPRRRSLESTRPSFDSAPETQKRLEIVKIDMLSCFGGFGYEEDLEESAAHQQRVRSRKVSEVNLGKPRRRISAGMGLSGKKDKTLSKVGSIIKMGINEVVTAGGKDGEVNVEIASTSTARSRSSSRHLASTPVKTTQKEKSKLHKQPKHDAQKAAYLHRLLEDSATSLSNPLAVLRVIKSTGPGISSQWSKVGSVQSIEDCLKMFTGVEVLDGDNMVGCRNCWKIAHGQRPERHNSQSEDDSESPEEDENAPGEDQPSQPEIIDSIHTFSMPDLTSRKDTTVPSLPPSIKSTPSLAPALEVEAVESDSLDLNHETFIPPVSGDHDLPASSIVPHHVLEPAGAEGTIYERPSGIEPGSGLNGVPIPTITANSPPPDVNTFDFPPMPALQPSHGPVPNTKRFSTYIATSGDSLRLPPRHSHHRRDSQRDGESSLSSEESEGGDTSGVSDGDGSVASVPISVGPLRPSKSGISRSKQVVYRRALKRYLISRPPPVLVIHLKRFQQVSKSPVTLFGNLKKLDEYVSFPEFLDIRPFLAPEKEDYGLGAGELRGKVVEKGKRTEDQPCIYRLYAVVVHIGNMLGGHYIAYTALPTESSPSVNTHGQHESMSSGHASVESKPGEAETARSAKLAHSNKGRQWCYISDTVVRLASLEEVLKSKAYICMYERLS